MSVSFIWEHMSKVGRKSVPEFLLNIFIIVSVEFGHFVMSAELMHNYLNKYCNRMKPRFKFKFSLNY